MSSYKTISAVSHGLYKEKGSKLQCSAFPINDEIEIKECLKALKKDHPKSRHVCYAYRLGLGNLNFRANDDGEPSGTAGKPILGQIDSFELTNILVAVVRYFGGKKLGASGLINAYRTAAADALAKAKMVTKEEQVIHHLEFEYDKINGVMAFLKKQQVEIKKQNFEATCYLKVSIVKEASREFLDQISKIINQDKP